MPNLRANVALVKFLMSVGGINVCFQMSMDALNKMNKSHENKVRNV